MPKYKVDVTPEGGEKTTVTVNTGSKTRTNGYDNSTAVTPGGSRTFRKHRKHRTLRKNRTLHKQRKHSKSQKQRK